MDPVPYLIHGLSCESAGNRICDIMINIQIPRPLRRYIIFIITHLKFKLENIYLGKFTRLKECYKTGVAYITLFFKVFLEVCLRNWIKKCKPMVISVKPVFLIPFIICRRLSDHYSGELCCSMQIRKLIKE